MILKKIRPKVLGFEHVETPSGYLSPHEIDYVAKLKLFFVLGLIVGSSNNRMKSASEYMQSDPHYHRFAY